MLTLDLHRFLKTTQVTLGALVLPGLPGMWSLELPWRDNRVGQSCIPAGVYQCVPHGWEPKTLLRYKRVWRVLNVPGRSAILLHAGNTVKDTNGCILGGMDLMPDLINPSIQNSRMAIDALRRVIGEKSFRLNITERA